MVPTCPFPALQYAPFQTPGPSNERWEVNVGPTHYVETAQLVLAPPKRQEIPSGNTDWLEID